MNRILQNYAQIFASYAKNKIFLSLTAIILYCFLGAPNIIKWLKLHDYLAPIISRIYIPFFVLIIWPVALGLILKAQFAHPRAVVSPEFRARHLAVALIIFLGYCTLLWKATILVTSTFFLSDAFETTFLLYIYLALSSLWIGYLLQSGPLIPLFITPYFLLPFLVHIIHLPASPEFLIFYSLGALFLLMALGKRLWDLREEMQEYHWNFTLRPYEAKNYTSIDKGAKWYEKFFLPPLPDISPYPYGRNLLTRCRHWMIPQFQQYLRIILLFGSCVAFLNFLVPVSRFTREFADIHIISLMMYPFFFTLTQFYIEVSSEFSSKPIRRKQLILELGLRQLLYCLTVFIVFFILAYIGPIAVLRPCLLSSGTFWISVIGTLSFGGLVYGLSGIYFRFFRDMQRNFAFFMVFYMTLLAGQLWLLDPFLSANPLLFVGAFVVLDSAVLWLAYHLWCSAELGQK